MELDVSSPQDQGLVDQTLRQGFRGLRFPAALERAFVIQHADERTFKLIVAGLYSLLVFGGILLADYLMMPKELPLAIAMRVGLYAPVVLVLLKVLHRLSLPQLNEWMVVLVGLFASGIMVFLSATSAEPLAYVKLVELIIVVIYVAVFARFWPMVVLSALVMVIHLVAMSAAHDVIGTVKISSFLLLATTMMFALYGTYKREHNDRLAFLLDLREQALRLTLQEANARLDTMARTDALTGVPNRRFFDEFLAQAWSRAATLGQPLSLLLIDVDHFKAFNDRYGHQAGDRCLCVVAEAIASCLRRPVDVLARWGGEEFVVVLAEADTEAAAEVAQRVRQAVQDCALPHVTSVTARVVTVSVGVATAWPAAQGSQADLLQRTDTALYQAKATGRNRFCADEAVAQKVGALA